MKKYQILLLPLLVINPFSLTYAEDNNHIVGVSVGYATQEFTIENKTANDGDAYLLDIYYRHMYSPYWGLEGGFLSTTGGITSSLTNTLSEVKDASFYGPRLALHAELPLIWNLSLYGKAGINYYQVKYTLNDSEWKQEKLGAEAAIGVGLRLSVIGINLEYKHLGNDFVKSQGVSLGITSHF